MRLFLLVMALLATTAQCDVVGRRGGWAISGDSFQVTSGSNRAGNSEDMALGSDAEAVAELGANDVAAGGWVRRKRTARLHHIHRHVHHVRTAIERAKKASLRAKSTVRRLVKHRAPPKGDRKKMGKKIVQGYRGKKCGKKSGGKKGNGALVLKDTWTEMLKRRTINSYNVYYHVRRNKQTKKNEFKFTEDDSPYTYSKNQHPCSRRNWTAKKCLHPMPVGCFEKCQIPFYIWCAPHGCGDKRNPGWIDNTNMNYFNFCQMNAKVLGCDTRTGSGGADRWCGNNYNPSGVKSKLPPWCKKNPACAKNAKRV